MELAPEFSSAKEIAHADTQEFDTLRHAADPSIDEAGGTPISPDLASGGPSWPQDPHQTPFYARQNLGASVTASGDHSEASSDNFPRFWVLSTT